MKASKKEIILKLLIALTIAVVVVLNNNTETKINAIENNIKKEVATEKPDHKILTEKNNQKRELIQKEMFVTKDTNILKNPYEESKTLKVLEPGDKVIYKYKIAKGWAKVSIESEDKSLEGYVKYDTIKEEQNISDKALLNLIRDKNKKFEPNMIYFRDKGVKFFNTGANACQPQIDKYPETAATFGGTSVFSGKDNMNTHFAAHNYGAFNNIWNLNIGEEIIVTDNNAEAYYYKVDEITKVTYDGYRYDNGGDYWDHITGTGGGERIVLQTCIFGDPNGVWIISASQK